MKNAVTKEKDTISRSCVNITFAVYIVHFYDLIKEREGEGV